MSDIEKVGYANPPKTTQWKKGQSGNPKGRPKTRVEFMKDAAKILKQPVEARGTDGKTLWFDGVEAGYLALCRKGLKGHKSSLLEAIRIMCEVGPAVEEQVEEKRARRQRILDSMERMGVKIPDELRMSE